MQYKIQQSQFDSFAFLVTIFQDQNSSIAKTKIKFQIKKIPLANRDDYRSSL